MFIYFERPHIKTRLIASFAYLLLLAYCSNGTNNPEINSTAENVANGAGKQENPNGANTQSQASDGADCNTSPFTWILTENSKNYSIFCTSRIGAMYARSKFENSPGSIGKIYTSFDSGETWSTINAITAGNASSSVAPCLIDDDNPNMIISRWIDYGTRNHPPTYKTLNRGATWSETDNYVLLATDPNKMGTIYGYRFADNNSLLSNVQISGDFGNTWSNFSNSTVNGSASNGNVIFNNSDSNAVYLTNDGIYLTRDRGASWSQIHARYHLLAAGSPTRDTLFGYDRATKTILKSVDNGTNWSAIRQANVRDFLVVPWNPNIIYEMDAENPNLPSSNTLYGSSDGGKTWIHQEYVPADVLSCADHFNIDRIKKSVYIHPQSCADANMGIYRASP